MTDTNRAILTHLPKVTPYDIKFDDIKFSVRQGGTKKKHILKGVSGCFQAGELTAIMGPSGAGKSSLLNILTGFQQSGYKGLVQATNIKECTSKKLSTRSSCYIMQDDRLSPLFTVLEIMMMAADLKLKASYKYKQLIVDDILDTIGLVLSKHTLCGRLSGGQKKRLSIALELIDNPPIMFLDEPTTGLDSVSTNQCVAMLKALARGGRTIVCTIHQPSATIFEMVDHLYVIAEGYCVYKGSSANTIPYLQTIGLQCPQYHNPADFLLEVVTGEYGHFTSTMMSAASDSWRSQRPPLTYNIDSDAPQIHRNEMGTTEVLQPPSEFVRFGVLLNRCIIQLYRDWTVTHLKMLLHFAVGILLGLLFSNMGVDGSKVIYNIGFFMASLVYLSYTSLIPAILKFPSELVIMKKEQFNNWYKLHTFFAAFLITNLPVQMCFCFVYTSVSYYLSSQLLSWTRFTMFLVVCQLMTLISEGLGLILGTVMSPVNGVFIGSVMTALVILFAGFICLFNHMPIPLYYFSFTSYMRWALEGLVVTVYGYGREPLECPPEHTYCHYRIPGTMFKDVGMKDGNYWTDVGALTTYFLVVTTLGYFCLHKALKN